MRRSLFRGRSWPSDCWPRICCLNVVNSERVQTACSIMVCVLGKYAFAQCITMKTKIRPTTHWTPVEAGIYTLLPYNHICKVKLLGDTLQGTVCIFSLPLACFDFLATDQLQQSTCFANSLPHVAEVSPVDRSNQLRIAVQSRAAPNLTRRSRHCTQRKIHHRTIFAKLFAEILYHMHVASEKPKHHRDKT